MTSGEENILRDYCNFALSLGSKINIFGFKRFDDFWKGGILPSLELSAHIPYGSGVVDIGSGGGIPAIPLAICRKDCNFILIEPRKGKCLFLYECIFKLGLKNCTIHKGQCENYFKENSCDVITLRGLRPTKSMVKGWANGLSHKGVILIQTNSELKDKISSILGKDYILTIKKESDSYPLEILGYSLSVPHGTLPPLE